MPSERGKVVQQLSYSPCNPWFPTADTKPLAHHHHPAAVAMPSYATPNPAGWSINRTLRQHPADALVDHHHPHHHHPLQHHPYVRAANLNLGGSGCSGSGPRLFAFPFSPCRGGGGGGASPLLGGRGRSPSPPAPPFDRLGKATAPPPPPPGLDGAALGGYACGGGVPDSKFAFAVNNDDGSPGSTSVGGLLSVAATAGDHGGLHYPPPPPPPHLAGFGAQGHHHHHLHHHQLATYSTYMADLDYSPSTALFHSANMFKAAAVSRIRTKSHSSSGKSRGVFRSRLERVYALLFITFYFIIYLVYYIWPIVFRFVWTR